LLGTGTLSTTGPAGAGCLLELTEGGSKAIQLANGEQRVYLLDGDTVTLKGYCERPGYRRIGFGECRATVMPERTA
jgi:fumarylacetoacetase